MGRRSRPSGHPGAGIERHAPDRIELFVVEIRHGVAAGQEAIQPGVERVLDILRRELSLIMGQCGTPSLKDIGAASIVRL